MTSDTDEHDDSETAHFLHDLMGKRPRYLLHDEPADQAARDFVSDLFGNPNDPNGDDQ